MARDSAYRKAEEMIEAARQSGTKDLSLCSMKITELPDALGQLTQLQSLNLSDNGLPTLPEWLGQLTQLHKLDLSCNHLTALPEWVGQLKQLRKLDVSYNQLTTLPEWLGQLTQLHALDLSCNQLTALPESTSQLERLALLLIFNNELRELPDEIGRLAELKVLSIAGNRFTSLPKSVCRCPKLRCIGATNNLIAQLPDEIGNLRELTTLILGGAGIIDDPHEEFGWSGIDYSDEGNAKLFGNHLTSIPISLCRLEKLNKLTLLNNPLVPELAAAYEEGFDAVKRYLLARMESHVVLNEAKLILVGEGEVGKSCLLGALRGDPWDDGRLTTHGIEIKPVKVIDPITGTEITLNGWDFGGQRIYRPTHQLFFSAPAVYLVVWKPREGPQAGAVKDWIKLVKSREPDAKILVVATHGGPKERQPDIDRQEIWDLFGKSTVIDFFHVDSRPPDEKDGRRTGECQGIKGLKDAIIRLAVSLPEMGRSFPKHWQDVREWLKDNTKAYLSVGEVFTLCKQHKVEEDDARLLLRICHRVGDLIHYEHDPALRDIVVLKPDWLATAVSFVLDDKQSRDAHGLVSFARLGQLWSDPSREEQFRYSAELHPIFLRLMQRFDLSYVVAGQPLYDGEDGKTSLIAQLVPDVRPMEEELCHVWPERADGDEEQVQICRIVDAKGQSALAEGLFYQLIVRLHKFSLGREDFHQSVHWQRGLVLDDDYNGRALLEHIGNDVRIHVRAAYPGAFLAVLTHEVKWLVENFWEGLRCEVVVPCVDPCGMQTPGTGAFEVEKLIAFKRQGLTAFPCLVSGCNQLQEIDCLLKNSPSARRTPLEVMLAERFDEFKSDLAAIRGELKLHDHKELLRFRQLSQENQRILSEIDDAYRRVIQSLTDEAKEGPRLFSFEPVSPGFFDRPNWISENFRITLWCEHSRLPLPALNGKGDLRGVYEFSVPRVWVVKAAPFLKLLAGMLSLVVPVAASATRLMLDDVTYKDIEKQLDLGQKSLDSVLKGAEKAGSWLGHADAREVTAVEAHGAILRQLQAWLKEIDPSFGGLVRVMNKRQEFLWVHPQFESLY